MRKITIAQYKRACAFLGKEYVDELLNQDVLNSREEETTHED